MKDATAKSRALLLANLTPEHRYEFETRGAFTVRVKDETYELRPDITERLSDHARFCAVIPGLPVYDQMLARKLYLEHDPEGFFRAANKFEVGQGRGRNRSTLRDSDLAWHHFRAVLMREFSARGMDPRLIEVRWTPMMQLHDYELSVIYAGRYHARHVLATEHFYVDNLAAVVEAEAQYLTDHISRLVDQDKDRGLAP